MARCENMFESLRRKWSKSKDASRADWNAMRKELNLDQRKLDMQTMFLLVPGSSMMVAGAIWCLIIGETEAAWFAMQLGCIPILLYMASGAWLNLRWWWYKRKARLT